MILGAWFLCREVELACLRASLVEVGQVSGRLAVTLTLPVSKTDPAAAGTARSQKCQCGQKPTPACPVHCLMDQLGFLRRRFPSRWCGEVPDEDLPLFPDEAGNPVEEWAMTETIVRAAGMLKVPVTSQAPIYGSSLKPGINKTCLRKGSPSSPGSTM